MQEREIMVANTETQTRKVIKSSAETLAELKGDFDANGISYAGLDITEGISKTALIDDSSQLPRQVMYKGSPTDNLVILITRTKKKVASGATGERQRYFSIIKEHSLQDDVKEAFAGRNHTQVGTQELHDFLDVKGYLGGDGAPVPQQDDKKQELNDLDDEEPVAPEEEEDKVPVAECVYLILMELARGGRLRLADLERMGNAITKAVESAKEHDSPVMKAGDAEITDQDIDDMIAGMQ